MKNQKINYKLKIHFLIFFLFITFGAIGQELIREDVFMYFEETYSVDSLKSRYLIGSGSKKQRLEEIMMPVERYQTGSLSIKSETIKSDDEWNIYCVHNGKLFSGMSNQSLVLDANGKPHIAYGQTHLYYAWYDEDWHIETVDDSWDVGWNASLALDSYGHSHISFYDRDSNGYLKYTSKRALETKLTIVASAGNNGSIMPSREVEVEYKNDQTFIITSDEGFRIASITVDGSNIDLATDENWDAENGEYTFFNVTENYTIEVGFDDATSIGIEDDNEIKVYSNPISNNLWIYFYHQGNEKLIIVLKPARADCETSFCNRHRITAHKNANSKPCFRYLLAIHSGRKGFYGKKVIIEN